MRKNILVVALLVVAIVLVLAVPAFANTGTKSGGYWPYNTTLNAFVGLDGNNIVASPTVSPHRGYSDTTGKCKVCHAVHGAGSTNLAGTTLNATQVLLRTTKADACQFCHLTGGTFAMDPYYNTTFGTSSLANYHGNGGGWVSATMGFNSNTGTSGGTNWFTTAGGPSATQYTVPQSGHNAIHSHSIGNTYQGCNSCHAVHGANTMSPGTNILKNDPARGVIANEGAGWNDYSSANLAYGSISAPTTNQEQFCEDCHDGTKLVRADGTKPPIVSQADFDTYFPNCRGSGCHNSVSPTITANVTQFGAFANKGHDGRSHIMTSTINPAIAVQTSGVVSSAGITASFNGCQRCHSVAIWNGTDMAVNTFPHWSPSNELIPAMSSLTAIDKVCLLCHPGVSHTF